MNRFPSRSQGCDPTPSPHNAFSASGSLWVFCLCQRRCPIPLPLCCGLNGQDQGSKDLRHRLERAESLILRGSLSGKAVKARSGAALEPGFQVKSRISRTLIANASLVKGFARMDRGEFEM